MEAYCVTFVMEKHSSLWNRPVNLIVDDKKLCELKIKTGDSVKVELPHGKHHIALTCGDKRFDSDFFVDGNETIRLSWNNLLGTPEIVDIGNLH